MDATAPHDDVHEHPDFDFHVTREGGKVRAVIWLYGTRHEMVEVVEPQVVARPVGPVRCSCPSVCCPEHGPIFQ